MGVRFPIITAHSGCMDTTAHTLHSIETAIRLGADVVEEDVRVTRDGTPVLAHDDEWTAPDGRECRVSQMTLAEIRELQPLCTLEEMLLLIKASGKTANLDLKVDESIEPVAALVKKHDLLGNVFLSGCQKERAMKVQRTHPELRKLLNVDADLFLSKEYGAAMVQTCHDAKSAACFGININFQLVRRELMDYAAAEGLPVYVWTVDDEAVMKRFVELGAASITARNVLPLIRLKSATESGLTP